LLKQGRRRRVGPTGGLAMPLYSFHCATCDKDVELLLKASDTAACPACGAQNLERLVSRPTAEGKSGAIIKSARAQAAREGHLSNFSRAERRR
jgi:putative FmdB family regulatory protein